MLHLTSKLASWLGRGGFSDIMAAGTLSSCCCANGYFITPR